MSLCCQWGRRSGFYSAGGFAKVSPPDSLDRLNSVEPVAVASVVDERRRAGYLHIHIERARDHIGRPVVSDLVPEQLDPCVCEQPDGSAHGLHVVTGCRYPSHLIRAYGVDSTAG
jgi:hypothetical protein